MVEPHPSVSILGPILLVLVIGLLLATGRDPVVKQYGRPHDRARRRLASELDRWPKNQVDGVVRWHDFPALTRRDVIELLHERGWYYRGQDRDADGWPLYATRDPRLAESTTRPPSRDELLIAELRAAAATGEREYLLDLVPYWSLPRGRVAEVAERTGWRPGRPLPGCSPRLRLSRSGLSG